MLLQEASKRQGPCCVSVAPSLQNRRVCWVSGCQCGTLACPWLAGHIGTAFPVALPQHLIGNAVLQALLHAAAIGDTAKVQALLQGGLCPTAAISKDKPTLDWTTVHFAAANGHVASLELLLGAGAAAGVEDAAGATPLRLAVRHMHLDAVQPC